MIIPVPAMVRISATGATANPGNRIEGPGNPGVFFFKFALRCHRARPIGRIGALQKQVDSLSWTEFPESFMPMRDPRVDTYIANAAPFARPILTYIRKCVHKGCADVIETIKWNAPFFTRNGIVCNMAAFKAHCSLNFWKGSALLKTFGMKKPDGMGQFGKISDLKDLPDEKTLIAFVKEAARLDDEKQAPKKRIIKPKAAPVAPEELLDRLRTNANAAATFQNFSPSHQREYIEWITEAKREETRTKRLEQTVAWLAEGKPRNWKYQNC